MLRKYSEVLLGVAMVADLAVVIAAWLGAIWLRFETGLLPAPPKYNPHYRESALLLLAIVPAWHLLLRTRDLYDLRRMRSATREARRILEVTAMGTALVITATFALKLFWLSRAMVALFAALSALGLIAFRGTLRLALVELRRRGHLRRRTLIVGTGQVAREVYRRLQRHPEAGFVVMGLLGPPRPELTPDLPPHLGDYEALHALVLADEIDHVVIALDRADGADPIKMIEALRDTTAAVRFVPDLIGLATVQSGVEDLEGLPMIRVVESPLIGWSRILKRAFDIGVSGVCLLLLWPLFALIALAVKLSSPGPALYRQQRMSLNGDLFEMAKFRSMRVGAEQETGAVWAQPDDKRRTPAGRLHPAPGLHAPPQGPRRHDGLGSSQRLSRQHVD